MHVILLEKIRKLGAIGDKVLVKPGFARNYLIPHGKAVPATAANIEAFEVRRADLEKAAADTLETAQGRLGEVEALSLTIAAKAGDEGKLFGSIGNRDIADAVAKEGVALAKREVSLPEGPIRSTGEYEVAVQLHPDVEGVLRLVVVPS